jgi:hypothetical protein
MGRTRKLGNIADVDIRGFLYYNSNASTWGTIPDSSLPGGSGSQGIQGSQGTLGSQVTLPVMCQWV